MKYLTFLSLIGLAFATKDYTGYQVWRSYPDLKQYPKLQSIQEELNLDIWAELRREGGNFDFMISPEHLEDVARFCTFHGIKYDVWISDVQAAVDKSKPSPTNVDAWYDTYHTFDEIQAWMADFAADHSDSTIGISVLPVGTSLEGRAFSALKITTNVDGTANRRSFVINCGIHAREWVSPASCMYYAEYLLHEYTDRSDVKAIMDAVDFYIIPSSNPDGYVFSHTDDRMWRKTRSPCGGLCTGVDPNRNWDANWGGEGASGNCCLDTYYGPAPFSEPCTKAQRDFVNGLPNVAGYIDIHAYSQMWMYPYGYTTDAANDYDTLDVIAKDSVAAIGAVHNEIYVAGQISTVIYVASGSTADYFYDNGVKCSWAVELRDTGDYGFALPEEFIAPTAEESFEGIITIAEAIRQGTCD